MVKEYEQKEIKRKLIELLKESKTGLSGNEISEGLGINRVTMAKYLNVFATQGLIQQKKIGNVNLWIAEEDTEQFQFPDDYFQVKTKLIDYLSIGSQDKVFKLTKSCLNSNADITKLVLEVIIPSIYHFRDLFDKGKLGNSELNLINNILSVAIALLRLTSKNEDPKKNVILLSADEKNTIFSEATASIFQSDSWRVFNLGNMSSAINVIFDLDLQKFLSKVWKKKSGLMIIIIFSETEEGLNFFSDSVNAAKKKYGKNLFLILCGKLGKKTSIKSDLLSEDAGTIFQWAQTKSDRLELG